MIKEKKDPFKIIRNTFFQVASRGLVVFSSLFITAILTRLLGVKVFGDYVFITSIILLFVGLTDFGTTTIAVRESLKKEKDKEAIFSYVFGLRIFLSILFFILFNFISMTVPQFSQLREASFVGSFVLFFIMIRTTSQSMLQSNFRLDIGSFLEVIASFLMVFLLLISLLMKQVLSINLLIFFWLISAAVSGLISLLFWKRYLRIRVSFDFFKLKEIFIKAFPLGLYLLVYAAYDRAIDSFFLKSFSGSSAVGFYGLAYKIHGNLIFGAAFLMNSIFPLISSINVFDIKIKEIFSRVYTFLVILGIFVILVGSVFSPYIINIVSGVQFGVSSQILKVLLFATFFSFLNHLNGYYLIRFDEQKKLLVFSSVSLLINMILNFIFIPLFSYWAAAIVTVITEGSLFFMTKIYLKRKYGLTTPFNLFYKFSVLLLKERNKYFNF